MASSANEITKLGLSFSSDQDLYQAIIESNSYSGGDTEELFQFFKSDTGRTSYQILADTEFDLNKKRIIELACESNLNSRKR